MAIKNKANSLPKVPGIDAPELKGSFFKELLDFIWAERQMSKLRARHAALPVVQNHDFNNDMFC